jgi:hypothetical protein
VQSVFDDADILVAGAEQRFDAASNLNAEFHSRMVMWFSRMREQQKRPDCVSNRDRR